VDAVERHPIELKFAQATHPVMASNEAEEEENEVGDVSEVAQGSYQQKRAEQNEDANQQDLFGPRVPSDWDVELMQDRKNDQDEGKNEDWAPVDQRYEGEKKQPVEVVSLVEKEVVIVSSIRPGQYECHEQHDMPQFFAFLDRLPGRVYRSITDQHGQDENEKTGRSEQSGFTGEEVFNQLRQDERLLIRRRWQVRNLHQHPIEDDVHGQEKAYPEHEKDN